MRSRKNYDTKNIDFTSVSDIGHSTPHAPDEYKEENICSVSFLDRSLIFSYFLWIGCMIFLFHLRKNSCRNHTVIDSSEY
jgi:hypothetical protein